MNIVKDWTTVELIEFLNTYKRATLIEKANHYTLMEAVREELLLRQPLIGMTYTL